MYAEDSFFTLTKSGQIGLLVLSFVLSVAMIGVIYLLTRRLPRLAALGMAILGFWAFDWLSPQIYYFYYMTQFDGLPIQSVIRSPTSPQKLLWLIVFQDEPTLSAHGRGLLAWALIVVAIWRSQD
ncbi:MAG: hypothetical protein ACR2OV_07000 [Hyphomicrobiaceae bacterium]